jgi:hypothetical protein
VATRAESAVVPRSNASKPAILSAAPLDGVGRAAVHAMARVGGTRTLVGAAAGLTALGLAVASRRGEG